MMILLFSASILLIFLLIKLLNPSKRSIGLKIFVIFGVIIGLIGLGLNSLFDNAFGASTPVNIRAENLTGKNIKIYSIAFWSNSQKGGGNYVTYDKKLKPNEKSDFWFENDGMTEFWIVAKNKKNEIEFLKVITGQETEFDFKIMNNQNIESNKAQIAKELTAKKDKTVQIKNFVFWINVALIGLLISSLIKIKKQQTQNKGS